ncbi:hypothetical protein [Paractinoplanes lichenicola]|uniref:Uncharacterized protein n=1 Tax=Paractinoplanes lichenicola TaxID=2802976 RepID=A0ABS1VU28_9ACTN|nr:hypothetical protein [Actinoplanes lichenicola]MBL7257989.1 hypothetical protein [Actinoplanes lichenicola]
MTDTTNDLMGNWDDVRKELETIVGGEPGMIAAASTTAAVAFFGEEAPGQTAALFSGSTVVRAFWWGFHVQFSHEDVVNILDAADKVNATVAAIDGNIPSPAAPWIKLLAPFVAALHQALRAIDRGNGIYVSMSWFAPGVFVPTSV